MVKPSLDIALASPDITAFKNKMSEASNHTGTVARQIARQFLDINTGLKDNLMASASRMALGLVGKIALAVGSFKLLSDAIGGAREQLKEMTAIAEKASNLNVSPEFLQRFTAESRLLKVEAGELEGALTHAFNATKDKSPIDIGEWDTGKEKITDVEKALRVLNATVAGGRLEGLVLFRDADTQEKKVVAVLKAMQQLEQMGQRSAALDLGERMFGSQLIDRMRQGKTSADSMLATMQKMSVESGDVFPNDLMVRAKEIDDQLKLADNRLSAALKPGFNDLASIMLGVKSSWSDVVNLISQAVEWTNKLGLTSDLMRKKNELADIKEAIKNGTALGGFPQVTMIPGVDKLYDKLGAEKPQDALRRRRDALQAEIDAAARGEPEGPPAPTSRGTGAAPTLKPIDGAGVDKLQGAADGIGKRTAALQAEAAAIDMGTAARERAKVIANLETVAKQTNAAAGKGENVVTAEQRRLIDDVAAAYSHAAQAMEKARVTSSIKFDRNTAMLSQSDVTIAQQLRDIYPDVASALASVEAAAMRTNEVMRSLGGSIESGLTSALVDAGTRTKTLGDAFLSFGKVAERAVMELVAKLVIIQPLMRGLQGGFGLLGFADGGMIGDAGSITVGNQSFPKFAEGGPIKGPGTGRSDSIPILASNGEFMVNAEATTRHRSLLEAINSGNLPAFADGGIVGIVPAPAGGMIGDIGGTSVSIGDINITGNAGTPAQNEDLTKRIMAGISDMMDEKITRNMRQQMRPGGLLKGS